MLAGMTEEHLTALLTAAEAKKDERGFQRTAERTLTLYVVSGSASFSVSKVEALRVDRDLLHARTTKGELYIVALKDVYAGAIEAPSAGARKAGFV